MAKMGGQLQSEAAQRANKIARMEGAAHPTVLQALDLVLHLLTNGVVGLLDLESNELGEALCIEGGNDVISTKDSRASDAFYSGTISL
jgi:hypothetical protein